MERACSRQVFSKGLACGVGESLRIAVDLAGDAEVFVGLGVCDQESLEHAVPDRQDRPEVVLGGVGNVVASVEPWGDEDQFED